MRFLNAISHGYSINVTAFLTVPVFVLPLYSVQSATISFSKDKWDSLSGKTRITDFNDILSPISFEDSPADYNELIFSVSPQASFPGSDLIEGNKIGPVNSASDEFYQIDGTPFVEVTGIYGSVFNIGFRSPITAFAATFTGIANDGREDRIDLMDYNNYIIDSFIIADLASLTEKASISFIGITSKVPVSSIRVTPSGPRNGLNDYFGFDNVYRSVDVVPEPKCWLQMALGFLFIGCIERRGLRSQSAISAP